MRPEIALELMLWLFQSLIYLFQLTMVVSHEFGRISERQSMIVLLSGPAVLLAAIIVARIIGRLLERRVSSRAANP